MASARSKGTLKKWFDDKGFGFITSEKGSRDIFVHISAFDRNIPRRPEPGDIIFFYTSTDRNGKTKAVDAVIEGAAPVIRQKKSGYGLKRQTFKKQNSSWKLLVLTAVLLIGGGSTLYKHFQSNVGYSFPSTSEVSQFVRSSSLSSSSEQYACDGKTHCSEMSSCEEATFYLHNCPNTKMDGDGDGVPCERQWCN